MWGTRDVCWPQPDWVSIFPRLLDEAELFGYRAGPNPEALWKLRDWVGSEEGDE